MHKKTILTDVVILTVTCGMMLFLQGCSRQDIPTLKSEETYLVEEYEDQVLAEDTNTTNNTCYVYVCGAVRNPGVYEMKPGERIFRAVELAGGFTGDCDGIVMRPPIGWRRCITMPGRSRANGRYRPKSIYENRDNNNQVTKKRRIFALFR